MALKDDDLFGKALDAKTGLHSCRDNSRNDKKVDDAKEIEWRKMIKLKKIR